MIVVNWGLLFITLSYQKLRGAPTKFLPERQHVGNPLILPRLLTGVGKLILL